MEKQRLRLDIKSYIKITLFKKVQALVTYIEEEMNCLRNAQSSLMMDTILSIIDNILSMLMLVFAILIII